MRIIATLFIIFGCNQFNLNAQCNPSDTQADYDALMAFYQSMDGENWLINDGWTAGASGDSCNPCDHNGSPWFGITCQNNRVICLDMDGVDDCLFFWSEDIVGNNLQGAIPSEIGQLDKLVLLSLVQNSVTGNIPNEIGQLVDLQNLSIGDNLISGVIPTTIGQLTKLRIIYASNNELVGQIPSEIGNLKNLFGLFIAVNNLSGRIPAEIGEMISLSQIILAVNELSGPIPPELSDLNNLNFINVSFNNLSGCYDLDLKDLCNIDYNFFSNPLLPWQGDFMRWCNGEEQVGAPCEGDGIFSTEEYIQDDCRCLPNDLNSTSDLTDKNELLLFPNPTANKLNVDWSGKEIVESQISIHNSIGQKIELPLQKKSLEMGITIETTSLLNGIYFLCLQTGDQTITKKFIVTR